MAFLPEKKFVIHPQKKPTGKMEGCGYICHGVFEKTTRHGILSPALSPQLSPTAEILGVDSNSILFNHRSFQEPDLLPTCDFDGFLKRFRIPGFERNWKLALENYIRRSPNAAPSGRSAPPRSSPGCPSRLPNGRTHTRSRGRGWIFRLCWSPKDWASWPEGLV